MRRISGVKKLTDKRFLNLYELDTVLRDGRRSPYFVASRQEDPARLKAVTHDENPDGVILFAVYGEERDRVVLIRQYRAPIDGYIYELPAGLVEPGEDPVQAGVREMYEETGLVFSPVKWVKPFYTTVGMTDECCCTVLGYCSGTPTNIHQDGTEDIQVILADREECRRILKEERVALPCGYMLMHFVAEKGDPLAFPDA